jgi:hypothetical protein
MTPFRCICLNSCRQQHTGQRSTHTGQRSTHLNTKTRDTATPPPGSSSQGKSRLSGHSWHTTADTEAAVTVREVGPICERGPQTHETSKSVRLSWVETCRRPRFRSSCLWVRWWVPVCARVYRVCPGSLRCLFIGTVWIRSPRGRAGLGRCVGGLLSVCPVFVPCPVCLPAPPVSFTVSVPAPPGVFLPPGVILPAPPGVFLPVSRLRLSR